MYETNQKDNISSTKSSLFPVELWKNNDLRIIHISDNLIYLISLY